MEGPEEDATVAKHGTKYVPADGPVGARIMLVGESPGEDEEREGLGFVGKSGQILWRYLNELGIEREQCFVSNLCHYRPSGNKFANVLTSEVLQDGLLELKADIERIRPNVIVALGNWPLYFLTGKCGTKNNKPAKGTGILLWRGSIIPSTLVERGNFVPYKCVAALHPAALLRQWTLHPTLKMDLARAVEESNYPDFRLPKYESLIDRHDLVEELSDAEWLSCDIETYENPKTKRFDRLACVGFSDSVGRGVCFTGADGDWSSVRDLLRASCRKVFHYGGGFDIPWLNHYFPEWEIANFAYDTFIASATIHPEWPRTLNFLASIYTKIPYWKDDRKGWKVKGDKEALYHYNNTDTVVTSMVRACQEKELNNWPVEVKL